MVPTVAIAVSRYQITMLEARKGPRVHRKQEAWEDEPSLRYLVRVSSKLSHQEAT